MLTIFFAVKQIVDVLYQFRILDYVLVVVAGLLIAYGIFKEKYYKDFFSRLQIADYVVAMLGIVYLMSFLRDTSATSQFLKTESAFFIYFLGRVFGRQFANTLDRESTLDINEQNANVSFIKKIIKQKQWQSIVLAVASYIIVYANFLYKMYVQITYKRTKVYVGKPEFNIHSDGALYYYKTDMAIGIIVALIFVYVFGKNQILKWITILPIGVYMLFYETQAKAGQIILIIEYVLIIFVELWKRGVFKKISCNKIIITRVVNIISILMLLGITIFFVFISAYPPMQHRLEDLNLTKAQMRQLEHLFHSRHLIWWDALSYYVRQPFGTRLLGIDLVSETMHNSLGDRFHNLYFKQVYSIGYLGCYLYTILLCILMRIVTGMDLSLKMKKQDASTKDEISASEKKARIDLRFLIVSFWVMFLIMSVSMEGLEYTQMSWYPFIMLGVLISAQNKK